MKVGIILFSNMRYSPYLNSYTKLLNSIPGISYEVIYFNRYKELGEGNNDNTIGISWFGKNANASNKVVKAFNFFRFKYKVQHILDKGRYDYIICLTTVPAVLISKYLVCKYAGRYIVDIRDYTYEQKSGYYTREEKVLNSSALNIISSPGFVNFLPKAEYTLLHNFNGIDCSDHKFIKNDNYPIKIAYIGSISYASQCKKMIDMVAKDNRFEFDFYGNESSEMSVSEYVKQVNNPRIRFNGKFLPTEKEEIYLKSDLVFNCYGNDRLLVKYAISNKYYDGAVYRKPLLVSPKTAMEELSEGYAYPLDLDAEQSLDKLVLWYRGIDCNQFEKYCQRVLDNAVSDNKIAEDRILSILRFEG